MIETPQRFGRAVARGRIDDARAALTEAPNWGERLLALESLGADDQRPFLDGWARTADPIGLLASGAWHRRRAGVVRSPIGHEPSNVEWDRLRHADLAERDLFAATAGDPTDPLPWHLLLDVAAFHRIGQAERQLRLDELLRRAPGDVEGHLRYAHVSSSRWDGDDERLWVWALQLHDALPAGSPLRAIGAVAWTRAAEAATGPGTSRSRRVALVEMAEASVLHPGILDHPLVDVLRALEEFAVALHFAGAEGPLARLLDLHEAIGTPWPLWPWADLDDPWERLRRTGGSRRSRRSRVALG